MTDFLSAFLPLFVAMNVLGVLPLFIGMTEALSVQARHKLVLQALTAACIMAVIILFAGDLIFKTLGITINDLRVGGGLVLLVLSINDLIFGDYRRRTNQPRNGEAPADLSLGIVPIGIPLTIGPAAITTILIAQQSYGYPITLAALVANLLIVFVAFWFGPRVMHVLGKGASRALAKVASLFLTAIAVAMIRTGIEGFL